MGMIGLTTEKVSPPHEPDTTFVLRTALSPYECEWVKERAGQEAMGSLARAVGPEGIDAVFKAIDAGREAADIVDDLNDATPVLALSPATDGDDDAAVKVTAANKAAASKKQADDTERAARSEYDLDFAALKLIKAWSYKDAGRKVPVTLDFIRLLDAETRAWIHDKAWAAMRIHLPEDVLAGNS